VFEVDASGTVTVLHNFSIQDGAEPTQLYNFGGTLFGIAACGGKYNNGNCYDGVSGGTVFQIDTHGKVTVLHSFNGTDGAFPTSLADVDGTLYGTASGGGSGSCQQSGTANGCGVIFRISRTGANFEVLYKFGAHKGDAAFPVGLTFANGKIYGTSQCGGAHGTETCIDGSNKPGIGGTVFEISTTGSLSILHSFAGGADGSEPQGSLLNVGGTLYGTTARGGAKNGGTFFSLNPAATQNALGATPLEPAALAAGKDAIGPAGCASRACRLHQPGYDRTLHQSAP
jgi:uncharacterized repeat protein (TIGR03803 family)